MSKKRKTLFEKAVEANGYCCPVGFFAEHKGEKAEYLAELLDVGTSTIYYNKARLKARAPLPLCHKCQESYRSVP